MFLWYENKKYQELLNFIQSPSQANLIDPLAAKLPLDVLQLKQSRGDTLFHQWTSIWVITRLRIVHLTMLRETDGCASIHHADELIFPLEIIAGNVEAIILE